MFNLISVSNPSTLVSISMLTGLSGGEGSLFNLFPTGCVQELGMMPKDHVKPSEATDDQYLSPLVYTVDALFHYLICKFP